MKNNFTKTLVGVMAALFLLITFSLQVKSQMFSVGDKDLNLGIGFGTHWGNIGTIGIPPVSISMDYGFKDDLGPGVLGIGGFVGIATSKYKYSTYLGDYGWKYTNILIGARGTYHMEFIDKLDTYAGVIIGLRYTKAKEYGDWFGTTLDSNGGLYPEVGFYVGGKYFVADNIAIFGEIGYSIAYLTIGATFRLQ